MMTRPKKLLLTQQFLAVAILVILVLQISRVANATRPEAPTGPRPKRLPVCSVSHARTPLSLLQFVSKRMKEAIAPQCVLRLQPQAWRHILVIDAGSSGTRMSVFPYTKVKKRGRFAHGEREMPLISGSDHSDYYKHYIENNWEIQINRKGGEGGQVEEPSQSRHDGGVEYIDTGSKPIDDDQHRYLKMKSGEGEGVDVLSHYKDYLVSFLSGSSSLSNGNGDTVYSEEETLHQAQQQTRTSSHLPPVTSSSSASSTSPPPPLTSPSPPPSLPLSPQHHPPFILYRPHKFKDRPGLSVLAHSSSLVRRSVRKLLRFAKGRLHPSLWHQTPVFLYATGGVRLLDPSLQQEVLSTVRWLLSHSGFLFKPEWAQIITGAEEGIYLWQALRYASQFDDTTDAIQSKREAKQPASSAPTSTPPSTSSPSPSSTTQSSSPSSPSSSSSSLPSSSLSPLSYSLGVLELGGASMQATIPLPFPAKEVAQELTRLRKTEETQGRRIGENDSSSCTTHCHTNHNHLNQGQQASSLSSSSSGSSSSSSPSASSSAYSPSPPSIEPLTPSQASVELVPPLLASSGDPPIPVYTVSYPELGLTRAYDRVITLSIAALERMGGNPCLVPSRLHDTNIKSNHGSGEDKTKDPNPNHGIGVIPTQDDIKKTKEQCLHHQLTDNIKPCQKEVGDGCMSKKASTNGKAIPTSTTTSASTSALQPQPSISNSNTNKRLRSRRGGWRDRPIRIKGSGKSVTVTTTAAQFVRLIRDASHNTESCDAYVCSTTTTKHNSTDSSTLNQGTESTTSSTSQSSSTSSSTSSPPSSSPAQCPHSSHSASFPSFPSSLPPHYMDVRSIGLGDYERCVELIHHFIDQVLAADDIQEKKIDVLPASTSSSSPPQHTDTKLHDISSSSSSPSSSPSSPPQPTFQVSQSIPLPPQLPRLSTLVNYIAFEQDNTNNMPPSPEQSQSINTTTTTTKETSQHNRDRPQRNRNTSVYKRDVPMLRLVASENFFHPKRHLLEWADMLVHSKPLSNRLQTSSALLNPPSTTTTTTATPAINPPHVATPSPSPSPSPSPPAPTSPSLTPASISSPSSLTNELRALKQEELYAGSLRAKDVCVCEQPKRPTRSQSTPPSQYQHQHQQTKPQDSTGSNGVPTSRNTSGGSSNGNGNGSPTELNLLPTVYNEDANALVSALLQLGPIYCATPSSMPTMFSHTAHTTTSSNKCFAAAYVPVLLRRVVGLGGRTRQYTKVTTTVGGWPLEWALGGASAILGNSYDVFK